MFDPFNDHKTHQMGMFDTDLRFVLLHGAGLGSWIWDRVLPDLNAPVNAINLPGRGRDAQPGAATMEQCVKLVSNEIRPRSIVVAHSFSAEVAMLVAARQPHSVAAIVLVGGMVPESGRSFMSLVPFPQRAFLHVLLRLSRNGVHLPQSLVEKEYCSDLDDELRREVLSRIVPEAPRLYLDRVDWNAIPEEIPRFYVKLLHDKSVAPEVQERVRVRINAVEWETLPTGHLPMLAQPKLLADALNRLLGRL